MGVTIIAILKHGFKFFTYFFPSGVPIALAPLLIPIEIISYFIRPISLSVRLFANMLAGHTMMKVFAGLIIMMGSAGGILSRSCLTSYGSNWSNRSRIFSCRTSSLCFQHFNMYVSS